MNEVKNMEGRTSPTGGEAGPDRPNDENDVYIVFRSGSSAEASRTRHYILYDNGLIAFVLQGQKKEQVIRNPKERNLAYHVYVYRSNSGNRRIEVYDMQTQKCIYQWQEWEGVGKLLREAPPFLRQVIAKEVATI